MNRFNKASKTVLTFASFGVFFMTFLMSGNGNVLPQVFFQHYYPEQKTLLLSIALMSATVAAILGIMASRLAHISDTAVALLLLLTVACLEVMLSAESAVLFIACLVFVQFADNFVLNRIDHMSVERSGELRGFNDGANVSARLLGLLVAPAFFTIFADNELLKQTVIVALVVLAIIGFLLLSRVAPQAHETTETEGVALQIKPDRTDWLVFAHVIAVYTALCLLAANMIYLFRDLFDIPNPEMRGGLAIVVVFVSALLVNWALTAFYPSPPDDARIIRCGILVLPAVLLIIAATIILTGYRADYTVCLVTGVLIGGAYGGFLWDSRDYTSRAAKQGKTVLLSWFNNVANVSALLAFGLMLVLTSVGGGGTELYYRWLMMIIIGLQIAGMLMLFPAAVSLRRAKPVTV